MKKYLVSILLMGATALFAKQRPNFIVFIADDVSWNDLGCYGNRDVQTPNINKLAARGIRFDNAYLTASSCSPSRNSIMTGRYPHNTGAAELHTEPPMEMLSLAELLKKNGYHTVSSGKFHMGQYARRGFDIVQENRKEIGGGGEASWVESLQKRPQDKPFFMWYAAYDAHRGWGENEFKDSHNPNKITVPHYLVDEQGTRKDLAEYYGEIRRFDHYIGESIKVLEKQNVLDNTFIIIMADNGRPFPHSKTRVNDRGMKTPFIIHYPNGISKEGSTCDALLSSIDIAPTILSLSGTDIAPQFQGKSFEKLLENPADDFRNYVFAEHNWHDFEAFGRMVRNKDYMYILNERPQFAQLGPGDALVSPAMIDLAAVRDSGNLTVAQSDVFVAPRAREELYDYASDPDQWLNVASLPKYQEQLKQMGALLQQWMKETGDYVPDNITPDYFVRAPGVIPKRKTSPQIIRGEMPGSAANAATNNNPGPF